MSSKLKRVDANLLVVLDAILAERNLTRAGARIEMTQPAVSGALNRLRQQLGDELLVRVGRGFELTAKAQALQPLVQKAMVETARTLEVLPSFEPATSTRTFLISASDYILEQTTSSLIRLLASEAPGVAVEFDSLPAGSRVTPQDLLRRDILISRAGSVPGRRQELFRDQFVCITAASNRRLDGGRLSLDDITEMKHVLASFGEGIPTPASDMLAQAGVEPKVSIVARGLLPVPFMVSGTEFIGFIPRRLAERYLENLSLVIAETPLKPGLLVEAAHWHPSNSADPALQWLVAALRRATRISRDPGGSPEFH